MHKAKHGVDREEHEHDRAEEGRDSGRPAALRAEQQDENDDRRGQDVRREADVDLFQPFKSGKNGNRGRDHRIAREQGGSGDAEQKDQRRALPERALRQSHEG